MGNLTSNDVQYSAGQTIATPQGTVALATNLSNVAEPLKVDGSGNLLVNVAVGGGGGGGSNAAAGQTGLAVPAYADYLGINVGGNLVGVSAANPLPISGSISATNPSVGTNATTAPTSSTQVAFNASGNLTPVSASAPLPVTFSSGTVSVSNFPSTQTVAGSVSVSNFPSTQTISGTVTANAGTGTFQTNITNASIAVTGTFFQATQPVSLASLPSLAAGSNAIGSVSVSNFPATQTVSGTVGISGTVPVSGTFFPATQNVNIVGGSSGNGAASNTGSAVPAQADYLGFNVGGNLVGVSAANPLPISGTISATNPSVSQTNTTAPTSATAIGITDTNGLLQTVNAIQRLPTSAFENNPQIIETLRMILIELRVLNTNIVEGLLPGRWQPNLDLLRQDEDVTINLNG